MIKIIKLYTIEHIQEHPDWIFVFGDNLQGWGKAGQAIIRNEPNTLGVPTKRKPSMNQDAFFYDRTDEIDAVTKALDKIESLLEEGKIVVFPLNGLGTGLAKLAFNSPIIAKMIDERVISMSDKYL